MFSEGKFREDLLYRLNTAEIQLPPLRERKEDIPMLTQKFLDSFCHAHGKTLAFDPQALTILQEQEWPGNRPVMTAIVSSVGFPAVASRPRAGTTATSGIHFRRNNHEPQ
jgi:transcriptional regulator with PAS, ATPase and Fis domain